MSEHLAQKTHGPYRIVRNKDGVKTYFAGHHEHGQVRWVERSDDGVHYPDTGLAGTVQRALKAEPGESLNVVRITS
jgi:hypothetical protein